MIHVKEVERLIYHLLITTLLPHIVLFCGTKGHEELEFEIILSHIRHKIVDVGVKIFEVELQRVSDLLEVMLLKS